MADDGVESVRPTKDAPAARPEPVGRFADRGLEVAENLVYILAAFMLLAAAVAVLVATAYGLAVGIADGTADAVVSALDGLLLVFIVLELLAGVRATVAEHRLIAEPFLLVGIIASIKEIVVLTLKAQETRGSDGSEFSDAMIEIGVLGGLVVGLSVASFLVRRKEREPEEEDEDDV
jgi:uncharacterized membrane protein (DUF373 family)